MHQNRPNLKSIARVSSSLQPKEHMLKSANRNAPWCAEGAEAAKQVESQARKTRIKAKFEW